MAHSGYRKHFIPLESNPDVFNQLIRDLGVSQSLAFHDVLSIDDAELLAYVPRPVHALVLVFPTSEDYESWQTDEPGASELRVKAMESGEADGDHIVWFKQTIHNACGLYGILHAVTNGKAREYIKRGSLLEHLLERCLPLPPNERALVLENSTELEKIHAAAATQGDTAAPDNAEEEVNFHYVCFARSRTSGRLYELDGDKNGPVDTGVLLVDEDDCLSQPVLAVVRTFIERSGEGKLGFNLLALAEEIV